MSTKTVDVVIIGAGASGLQCAASLHDESPTISFMILEARDRVGGRILSSTLESQNESLSLRDHGASWIHGMEGNPMLGLLQENDVIPIFKGNPWTRPDTILHKENQIAIFMNQQLISNDSPVIQIALRQHYDLQRRIAQYANHLYETGNGMETARVSVQSVRDELKDEKQELQTEEQNMAEQLYPFYNFLNENWNGTSSTELQLGSVADGDDGLDNDMETDERYTPQGDFPGEHCKVKNGMRSILDPLMTNLDGKIKLNEKVVSAMAHADHVQVETSSGLMVRAKCCICTMPLGCLKKNAQTLFHPPLGGPKQEAFLSLSAGSYKKIFLSFDKIFWPLKPSIIGLVRDENSTSHGIGNYLLINNLWAKDGIPSLEAILCGDSGKWAYNKPIERIKRSILEFLSSAIPLPNNTNIHECCTNCHVTRWEEDENTLGSYSSFSLGTLERHVEALQSPEFDGRLLFAGEATESEHMGSVHAALISGKRAADYAQNFISHS